MPFNKLCLCLLAIFCIFIGSCENDSIVPWPPEEVLTEVHGYPQWSADGDSLYFIDWGVTEYHDGGGWSTDPDSAGLRIIHRVGGPARMVFNTPGFFTYSLSPDGAAACLVSKNLFIGNFSGGVLDPSQFQQITAVGGAIHASWSPDGDWIAFDTYYNDPRGALAVWKVRPDGTELTDLSVHGTGEWLWPSWDRTGTRIVYVRYVSGGSDASELFIMDGDGANNKRITNNDVMDVAPGFSPDGTRICYERYGNGRGPEVCVINANGSGHRVLASGTHPAWSHDGTEIAYVAATGEPRTNGTIWLVNVSTLRKQRLTQSRLE